MHKILFVLFFFSQSLFSQTIISGKVFDSRTKEYLIGANVIVKGTNTGISTNLDGFFRIKTPEKFPITIVVTYLGFNKKEIIINTNKSLNIFLEEDSKKLKEVRVIDSRLTKKQKESPLTIETMDIMAIKETPAVSFYDGLGSLKGVDLTAASLGFKIINTRGFNSTSPVRSLQIIDGVDNQAPGLNFSLGNFLGSSELDVMKVEIIQGASSAFYGPNAFNGVISMITRDPFIKPGLAILCKYGERNLFENAFRFAKVFKNKEGVDKFAFKINYSFTKAYDWEADNLAAVDGTELDKNNPGGYDAVNRYGDEDTDGDLNDLTNNPNLFYLQYPGLEKFHRTGYMEEDIVDYNTKNLKVGTALHYKLKPETVLIYALNYGMGTTVYQGENRFSLKNIQFLQNRMEIKKKEKFFFRAYRSQEDAGDSYDAIFTAIKLQEQVINNQDWYTNYKNTWRNNFSWFDVNWGVPTIIGVIGNPPQVIWSFLGDTIDINDWYTLSDSVLLANTDAIIAAHNKTRTNVDVNMLIPGTKEFEEALNKITSKISNLQGGTGFYDKSALNHIHAEYTFNPSFAKIRFGANLRIYQPDSKGSIFNELDIQSTFVDNTIKTDTAIIKIINKEYGAYLGLERNILHESLKINGTFRLDKNENFNFLFSPAASIVYKPRYRSAKNIVRLSFSSAIRNPTLSDQYLYYNTGRAILIGNISGHGSNSGPHYDNSKENLVTVQSLINYYLPPLENRHIDSLKFFQVDPIRPEQVKSIEIGYRTTLFDKLYLDVNYYHSIYKDFIGYKIGAKFNYYQQAGGYTISLPSIQAYRMAVNAKNKVTTKGFSIGFNYFLNPKFTINGNCSWNKLNEEGTDDPIIPAYNTPEFKYNLSLVGRELKFSNNHNILKNYGFSINYKWVEGFQYEGSPQFTGFVPEYDLLDFQISKTIPNLSSTIKIGASNILNNLHYEVYGGPYIGRLIYCSLLIELN